MSHPSPTIAVLGGTGAEGSGIALRLAHAGYRVIIGSRDAQKASAAAAELLKVLPGAQIESAANREAAQAADLAILTVPYSAQAATVQDVRAAVEGKILVDATVPLVPPKVAQVQLPAGGSAVAALQQSLGPSVRVVAAFQNVSAHHLRDLGHAVDCDVLVCGDDVQAREEVIAIARAMGLRAWHAGVIANAAAVEALTSVLIAINRRYKVPGAGLRITGLDAAAA